MTTSTKKFSIDTKSAIAIGAVIVVAATLIYFRTKGPEVPPGPPVPAGELSSAEIAPMLAKLRETTPVPDETPKALPIQDAERARAEQPFLERAESGDVLLLFFEAKLALLYRPSTNEIIASGPLNDGPPPAEGAPAP